MSNRAAAIGSNLRAGLSGIKIDFPDGCRLLRALSGVAAGLVAANPRGWQAAPPGSQLPLTHSPERRQSTIPMIFGLFRKSADADAVYAIYSAIVAQSRQPLFYADWG